MQKIYFASTNSEKIQIAKIVCSRADIEIEPVSLEIDEIQGEDPEIIVRDKVKRAYQQLAKPVVVSDDNWDIKALNGFPGPYMKSINYWFKPEDFLRLMKGVIDRRVILHQNLAYTDGNITKVFKHDITGQIINEVRGKSKKAPCMSVIALDFDNGKTIAEVFEQGEEAVTERYKNRDDAWRIFTQWYVNQFKAKFQ